MKYNKFCEMEDFYFALHRLRVLFRSWDNINIRDHNVVVEQFLCESMTRKEYRARKRKRTRTVFHPIFAVDMKTYRRRVTLCAQRASKNLPTCVRTVEISKSSALQDLSTSVRRPPTRAFYSVWNTLQQHVTYATCLQKGALCFKLVFLIESLNF